MVQAVLIAGPTASGKSALALALARRIGGIVVNADAMQVYRDLRILTARPTPAEEAQAPHRLYGHVDGAINYSVARYLADAAGTIVAAQAAGERVIVVGGTGLYLKALSEGLSDVPPVPAAVRQAIRQEAEGRPTEALHAALSERDPEAAQRLRPSDRLRVLRALEVIAATGRPLHAFQGRKQPGPLAGAKAVRAFLAPDRDWLRRRIDQRFETMIAAGALAELAALAARNLDPALPVMRAHGVPALMRHLSGALPLDAAIAIGQADTRRYAKRQFTWFRHHMPGWTWLAPEGAEEAVAAAIRRAEGR